jgi:hypothetical protein
MTPRRWVAYYRLQTRLMWQWRPTRLALLRRAVLSYAMACLALAITTVVVPGLTIDGRTCCCWRRSCCSLSTAPRRWCSTGCWCPCRSSLAQILGLAVQVLAIIALGRLVPGIV